MIPGEIIPAATAPIVLNAGREPIALDVTNAGDRPIQVGSHFHFFEVNRSLLFTRSSAYGRRLDIPAGTAVRFEPGESRQVWLIELAGRAIVRGLNGLVSGSLPEEREAALARGAAHGFIQSQFFPSEIAHGQGPDAA